MELPKRKVLETTEELILIRTSSENWHQHFEQSVLDNCLFTMKNGELLLLKLYVDDIFIFASDMEMLNKLKQHKKLDFEIK